MPLLRGLFRSRIFLCKTKKIWQNYCRIQCQNYSAFCFCLSGTHSSQLATRTYSFHFKLIELSWCVPDFAVLFSCLLFCLWFAATFDDWLLCFPSAVEYLILLLHCLMFLSCFSLLTCFACRVNPWMWTRSRTKGPNVFCFKKVVRSSTTFEEL